MSIKEKIDGVDTFKASPPQSASKRDPQDQTAKAVESVRSRLLSPDRHSSRPPSTQSDNGGPLRRSSGRQLLLADETQEDCEYVAPNGVAVFNVKNRSPRDSLIKAQFAQQAFGSPPHVVVPVRSTVCTTHGPGENPSPFKVSPRTDSDVNQVRVSSDPLPVPESSGQLQPRSKSTPVKKTDPRSAEEIRKAKLIREVSEKISQKGGGALLEYAWRGQMDHLTVFFDEINKFHKEGPREPIVRELSPFQHLVSPELRGNILIEGFNSTNCDVAKRRKLLELLCPINIMKKEKIEELRINGCELLFKSQMLWSFVTKLVDEGSYQDLALIMQQIPISRDLVGDLLVRATQNRTPNRDQIIEQLMTKKQIIPAIYLEEVAMLIKERQADERRNSSSVCVIC